MNINKEREDAVFASMTAFVVGMAIIGFILLFACGAFAGTPATWTLQGVSEWAQQRIASGSALPAVASYSTGDLFVKTSEPPILYRLQSGAWATMTGSVSGSGGVASHSELTELDFAASGHTGFNSAASFSAHTADQVDPHGATMTISVSVQVGSGTPDTFFSRVATGVFGIASYGYLVPETATPTSPATGTAWYDANLNKMRVYDGSAWNALW